VDEITIPKPDDWHLHLRDGAMLEGVLPFSARHFARAIIMPNLVPPVVTAVRMRKAYRDRIMAAVPQGLDFTPLMTLYLTEGTDPADVASAHASGLVTAVKLYPAGATTNSHSGVRDLSRSCRCSRKWPRSACRCAFTARSPILTVDIFDREAAFIETVLDPLRKQPA
jgi:dihydroorotase